MAIAVMWLSAVYPFINMKADLASAILVLTSLIQHALLKMKLYWQKIKHGTLNVEFYMIKRLLLMEIMRNI